MQLALNHLYQSTFDLKTAITLGVIVCATITAILWHSIPSIGGKKTSRRAFRRRAISIGLTKSQARLLESFVKKVREPASLLANTGELNRVLTGALRNCSDPEDPMAQNRQLEIYGIKQRIDRVFADRGNMTSSRQLRINRKITFQQENGERFPSRITANLKEFYCIGIPKHPDDKRWRKGSKIRQFILSIDGEEIVFESKVLGYTSIMEVPSIILGHTVRENRSSIRKHRRRAISGRTTLYPIRIVKKGRRGKPAMPAANNLGLTGNLIDLSPGGCSISSRSPLEPGELVKLVLEYKTGESVAVFGKIVDTRAGNRAKSIIHMMFTKASIENMNLINRYVYELC